MNSKEGNNNTAKKGRKTKYTPKIVERICELVAKDTYSVPELCRAVGIDEATFYRWKNDKSEFCEALEKAEDKRLAFFATEAKRSLLKKIQGKENLKVWNKILCGALVAFFPLYGLGNMLPDFISNPSVLTPLNLVVSSLYKFAFMLVLVSGGLMAFYRTRMQAFMSKIIPYGKMSLTNYITQSIAGAMLYYNWGFSLHDDLGITASLLAGMAFFVLQFSFCKWWRKHHDHGPLEYVWKRATWLK